MENIANIIKYYAELNKLYRAGVRIGATAVKQQKCIAAFWQSHNDIAAFEQLLYCRQSPN